MWLSQVDIVSSKQVVNSRKPRKRCSPFYLAHRKTLDFVAARLSMPRTVNAGGGAEIAAWLNGIASGLAQYASTLVDYGADNVELLRSLDIDDVNEIDKQLRAAGARPLQTKLIVKELKQVADVGGTPGTAPASAPRGAQEERPQARASGSKRRRDARATRSPVVEDGEDDEDEEEEEEGGGESEGEEASDDDEDDISDDEGGSVKFRSAKIPKRNAARQENRHGKRRAAEWQRARNEGRAAPDRKRQRSASSSNRHGIGGQSSSASAQAGRRRSSTNLDARGVGEYCMVVCSASCVCGPDASPRCQGSRSCAELLQKLSGELQHCERTNSEKTTRDGVVSQCK